MSKLSSTFGAIAILWPGDQEERRTATLELGRFASVARALHEVGLKVEPAVYADEFAREVRDQLRQVAGVLVWVNPIEAGRDRSVLDAMLREVASAGVFVSAHPEVILKMGTKEVLFQTRDLGWGTDTHRYMTLDELHKQLPLRLAGGPRVLKQNRGNGGNGVWKVETLVQGKTSGADDLIRARHAQRGCHEEKISLAEFLRRCEPYFQGHGRIIEQAYQERLPEGMIRCYLARDRVAGFGHQAVNALFPAPAGDPPESAPQPGPRLYHPPTKPEFAGLKKKMEEVWVPDMLRTLGLNPQDLPIIWDADFLLGPKSSAGEDSYVLCEINVSSVSPFPEDALPQMAQAVWAAVAGVA